MKSGRGRLLYELIFWASVVALVYFNRGLYKQTQDTISPVVQAYTDVVMFLIVLALFFFVNYLKEAIWGTFTHVFGSVSGKNPLNFDKGNLGSNIQRTARRLERKGDFQGAGDTYESLEMWRDAALVYERGNLFGKAANAWKLAGNTGKAIEFYEKDGNCEAAGEICQAEGLQDRAAKNFRIAGDRCLEANQFSQAAEFYEKSGDYNKAGMIFEQAHKADKALNCFEKAGNTEKLLDLIKVIPTADYHRRGTEFTQLVERTAETIARNGFPTEGARILEECNSLIRAAEVYASCRMWEKTAELYLRAGRTDLSEAAIARIEDKKTASDIAARLAIDNSNWQAAGERFEEAGKQNQAIDAYKKARNFEAAARIYESMGRYIMAGEMYSSGKNLTSAANAYAKAYDWRNAADCFEASGDIGQAIEAYANAGNYLKAGMLAIKLTDYARAIEYLQRIPSGSPDFQIGTGFLATAFYYQSHFDMSYELFNRVMDTLPLNKETLPVYYAFARNLETDNPKKALGLFRQVLGVDIHYSDVTDRAQRLEHIVTSMTSNFGNNTPIPVAGIHRQTPLGGSITPPPSVGPPASPAGYSSTTASLSSHQQTLRSHSIAPPVTPSTAFGTSQAPLLDGRYQLKEQISQAGRMTDYHAFDTISNKAVVVRTFPKPDDPATLRETMGKLASASHLNHPGISAIISYGETQGMVFCVTEQVPGQNLKQWIRSNGPMSLHDLRLFAGQVLNTLAFAHSQSLVHQNLRPEMLYIHDKLDEKIVISGFGTPVRQNNTADSVYMTMPDSDPQYLAPEQIVGGNIDERTDIYALGLLIFFALTARTPFEVKRINDTQEIARMQVQVALTRPSSIRATLPVAVDELFLKCVNKSPATRYQSAQELLKDINGLQTGTLI